MGCIGLDHGLDFVQNGGGREDPLPGLGVDLILHFLRDLLWGLLRGNFLACAVHMDPFWSWSQGLCVYPHPAAGVFPLTIPGELRPCELG